jgi:hypothetical protein
MIRETPEMPATCNRDEAAGRLPHKYIPALHRRLQKTRETLSTAQVADSEDAIRHLANLLISLKSTEGACFLGPREKTGSSARD